MWRISKEIESIVYAVDINHATERHLNPTLLNTLKKPALMICGVRNPVHWKDSINVIGDGGKKQNRTNIEQNIMSTVLATPAKRWGRLVSHRQFNAVVRAVALL